MKNQQKETKQKNLHEIENLLQKSLKVDLKRPVIRIPSKLESAVQHIEDQYLQKIHSDQAVSRECILYFLSFIHSFNENDNQGKPLYSKLLAELFYPIPYKAVVDACLQGTPLKGPIIQRANYEVGSHSYLYSFTPCYSVCHRVNYAFKTEIFKAIYRHNILKRILRYRDNPIIRNLLAVYPHVGMPSIQTLKAHGIAKAKDPNYRTKTGKKLIYRNRNPLSRYQKRKDFEVAPRLRPQRA